MSIKRGYNKRAIARPSLETAAFIKLCGLLTDRTSMLNCYNVKNDAGHIYSEYYCRKLCGLLTEGTSMLICYNVKNDAREEMRY